jgi:hypothetical protein
MVKHGHRLLVFHALPMIEEPWFSRILLDDTPRAKENLGVVLDFCSAINLTHERVTPMLTSAERQDMIAKIQRLPADLEVAVKGLHERQLDTPYREGGWTVRQVVHHLADAHVNGFIRVKLTLTEERPTIKPYDQNTWAQTSDVMQTPILSSLAILKGLHARLGTLLESLPESSFARSAFHPEIGEVTLDDWLVTLARHGENHLAQIAGLRTAKGW